MNRIPLQLPTLPILAPLLLALLLLVVAVGGAAPVKAERRVVSVGPEQLTGHLALRFPQRQCLMVLACVTLTDPVVRLRNGDSRVFVSARVRPDLGKQALGEGTVEMAGKPRYDASRGAFFVDEPALLAIEFPGVAPAHATTLAELTRGLLAEYLRQVPVWVLDERDAQQALAKLALRSVEVRDGALRFTIGDDDPP